MTFDLTEWAARREVERNYRVRLPTRAFWAEARGEVLTVKDENGRVLPVAQPICPLCRRVRLELQKCSLCRSQMCADCRRSGIQPRLCRGCWRRMIQGRLLNQYGLPRG